MTRKILFAVVAIAASVCPVYAQDGELAQVLAGFDRVQEDIRTLSAEFTETTESALLTDLIVARGRVYMTKPDSVRWEYSAPEEMRFVIREDTYTGYFPLQKRAEKRDIARWREQLFRFLGLGQASTELAKFYDISLGDPGPGMDHTWLLVMDPKKKRVRKRMDAVRFWISRESSMPVRVEYQSKSGNRRVIDFEEMLVNPELAASLYTVEIPDDVKVGKGFSALSAFSASGD
jgi:outer membrane lipoprotein-sorting protein